MADNYWQNQQDAFLANNEGQGNTDSGTWGWLTGSGTRQWAPDPGAYQFDPNALPEWARQEQLVAQRGPGEAQINAQNVDAARAQQGAGRGDFLSAIQGIQGRALDSTALGEMMMRQGQQQVAQNATSQMASAPGRFNPAALRQAQMASAGAGQNMALQAQQQAMASAIQERAARDQAVLGGYSNLSARDIQRLMAEQGQRQGDQNMWLKQQELGQSWRGMGMAQQSQADLQKRAYEQAKMQGFFGSEKQGDPTGAELIKGAAQIGAAYITKSDVRAKQNIRSAEPDLEQLSQALAQRGQQGYQYRPEHGGGPGYGPMAQDLEQAGPVGRALVAKDRDGMRYIRGDRATTATLGMVGSLQEQVNELKAALGEAVGGGGGRRRPTKAQQDQQYADTLAAIGMPTSREQQGLSAREALGAIIPQLGASDAAVGQARAARGAAQRGWDAAGSPALPAEPPPWMAMVRAVAPQGVAVRDAVAQARLARGLQLQQAQNQTFTADDLAAALSMR